MDTFCFPYFTIILPLIHMILAISMIPALYKYISSFNLKTKKHLFWSALLFFILVFSTHLQWASALIFSCYNMNTFIYLNNIFVQLLGIQRLILLGVIFMRLHIIFKRTKHRLSLLTHKIYWIVYILSFISFIAGAVSYANFRQNPIGFIIIMIGLMIGSILFIFLFVLFINKLVTVYRTTDTDPELMALITKSSLLSFIQMSSMLIFISVTALAIQETSIHFGLVNGIFLCIDMSVSFWTTILAYKSFSGWYEKMCGCCDAKCKSCWNEMIGRNDVIAMVNEVQLSTNN